jgi:hypothetical protein
MNSYLSKKRIGDLDEVMNITNIVQTVVLSYRELVLKKLSSLENQ